MKNSNLKVILFSCMVFAFMAMSNKGFSQRRLPDGTVIYQDGSRRLPNGTVVYPGRTNNTNNVNNTINRVLHPNTTYSTTTRNRNYRTYNRRNLPPGQAKKVYGGSARDYAPGQNKDNNWNRNRGSDNRGNYNRANDNRGNDNRDNGNRDNGNRGRGDQHGNNGHGDHGKGHGKD